MLAGELAIGLPLLLLLCFSLIRGFAAGAADFIGKPGVEPELVIRVVNWINAPAFSKTWKR
ncbi:MAG TPA: hypothetical protein V6C65_36845 [Allocoleopsis sp.]